MQNGINTLIRIQADFFQNKNELAFKALKGNYAVRKADDFTLSPNKNYKDKVLKFFSDEKEIALTLSEKSVNFLQKRFYSGNFIALKDNSIALSGEAAAFVEGWYKDIVYNRGFLKSNLNQNATIEGAKEHIGFKNSLKHESLVEKDGSFLVFSNSTNLAYQNGRLNDKSISLNELMDISLQSDKNADGEITFLESYAGEDTLLQGYENWLNAFLREYFNDENISIETYGTIAKRLHNEKAMSVGLYESVFEGSLYGGINALNAHRFRELKEDFKPKVDDANEQTPSIQTKNSPKKDDEKEEELMSKYPEFKALIKALGAENISQEKLENLRQKKKINASYQENSAQSSLKDEFTQSIFQTNLLV